MVAMAAVSSQTEKKTIDKPSVYVLNTWLVAIVVRLIKYNAKNMTETAVQYA